MKTHKVERLKSADGTWAVFADGYEVARGLTEREAARQVSSWTPDEVYRDGIADRPAVGMTDAERELLKATAAAMAGHMLGQGNAVGNSVADSLLEKLTRVCQGEGR